MVVNDLVHIFAGFLFCSAWLWALKRVPSLSAPTGSGLPPLSASTCSSSALPKSVRWPSFSRNWGSRSPGPNPVNSFAGPDQQKQDGGDDQPHRAKGTQAVTGTPSSRGRSRLHKRDYGERKRLRKSVAPVAAYRLDASNSAECLTL